MEKIRIPEIYEEDIIDLTFKEANVVFRYYNKENIVQLFFISVYYFKFLEFEYICDLNWEFGLVKYKNSSVINKLIESIDDEKIERAFGGEYDKLRHFRLTIDDVGMYDFICKDIEIKLM